MSNKFHVCITLGTRPEAIKLAPIVHLFRSNAHFQTSVILTGQHREMVAQVMQLFDITADYDLNIMQPKQTLTQITCNSLIGLEKLYKEIQPDIVLVQGDTTTAFAAALAAFYQQIPVGHVEAGLRTDNLFNPFPEEANRRLVSQIAQLHFAPTLASVENLQVSGVKTGIHHTGNTVIDALLYVSKRSPQCDIKGLDWSAQRVILATVHRRENWGEPLGQIIQAWLQILADFPDVALVLPMHLNPVVREPLMAQLGDHSRIFLVEPLDYEQLVGAMQRCYLIMSDSGGLQEEAPSLGKPVLVLRSTTERPEAIAAGTSKLVGTETKDIVAAAATLLSDRHAYEQMANVANPFGDGQSSQRILDIVYSFLA
ncbi:MULTISPECIES: non-hydrolyzing UDP-N-acetylglucosamine 2-epimerase [Pseudanabaena]|uniref:UDP-N-acetylglucosamine 2-epimerase (non-hydrolyzing) n=2 Tax=Pseudanabaena TaxID=1152 RepID=L8N282_9CYAN|nr:MULTISPECIES: UDP-N-acetylglucosamine 2-epimerase (non-hydrolyzing) [Pseudanabaena]ELS33791.1 UDP-N-Acetylglucosamine 2-epimerase [Pseudanabaena biceps PCC 7429]MDG3494013.1 UDP-N-acetylglucosamine 2-epimerase (non-hydrolyzing) [Pseudanabaena catenata USMAC16]